MSVRLRRIALLAAAFVAVSASAFGQGAKTGQTAGGVSLDTLPKHPIPYKAFKTAAKPKVKPKLKAAASSATPSAPVAPGANPPPPPPRTPSTGARPTPPVLAAIHPTQVPPAKPAVTPPPSGAAAPAKTPPSTPAHAATAPAATAPSKPSHSAPKPVAPAPAFIAPPPPLPPPQLGARLQPGQALPASELEAFIDGQIARAMASDHIAGAAVAVVQNGQLVMEKGYGAPSPSQRIDPRTSLVRLGSGSQIFTWIAALKAVEDGKLKLDAPVNEYLPEDLKLPDEGFNQSILFRHLMSHTAGFEDRALGRRYQLDAGKLAPIDDALRQLRPRRVRAAGLLSIPSDYGVALAGDVTAKVEGRPFDQLVEIEIFKPLGLSHTSFREPYPAGGALPNPLSPTLAGAVGTGFRWSGGGLQPLPFAYGQSLAPAIAASTSVDDMARLMITLLNNGRMGETTLYGPKTAALLRSPLQRPAPGVDGWAHGLAMQQLPGGFEALSDVGSAPGFQSNLSLTPGLNLGVFIVANTDTGAALARGLPGAIVQRFYAALTRTPAQGGAAQGADYAGAYLSADRAYHGLEAFADRLTLQSTLSSDASGALALHGADGARLFGPTATPDQFKSEDGGQLFAPTRNGEAQAYVLGSGGGAAARVGGLHSRGVLAFWAAMSLLTVLASFAGLFIRERIDPRETRAQIAANVTQVITCVVWCLAFVAFYLFAQDGLSTTRLMFDWPNRWLVTASWAALFAGALSLLMAAQLPGVWREERRIHGWPVWRKLRHTATVVVFLVFTAVLAAWGALEPWSS